MYKSITDHYIFYKYIVASLVIVVIGSGIFFLFKLHKYKKIQYAAVTQNINAIMYDCTLSNLQINIVNYLHECIKCLKRSFFSGLMYSIYIKYTSHKQVTKSGGSSSKHYL